MYPFQQSNELENQIPYIPCQPDQILDNLVTFDNTSTLPPTIGKKQRRSSSEIQENGSQENEHNMLKRIMHRDIERQRRQEMANLHASLRSLLPVEYIKGKRAISDHMQAAVNYIQCLQKNINQLRARRDELVIENCNLSNTFNSENGSGSGSADKYCCLRDCASVTVSQGPDGVEVLISISPKEENFPISGVLKKLLDEGLNVVSCVSTTTDDIKVQNILAE
ncbi:hypothetical protein ACH5RR_019621 [Cinchona calisaya]|uniref:BHLH domain-containing protein n=1 Tax=Cinchona calisaya TaxID=153742 RepID=A0ABD2ZPX1_9GENT